MLLRSETTVLNLDTGETASLREGELTEDHRALSLSEDGLTALVSTPTALQWWAITR
jgi:hypothetical protein